jgi:hypothetical protein
LAFRVPDRAFVRVDVCFVERAGAAFFRRALLADAFAAVRRFLAVFRADARAAPALRLGVAFFSPRFLPLVFAFFVVLAIHASGKGRPAGLRDWFLDSTVADVPEFDQRPLNVVSSNAYRNQSVLEKALGDEKTQPAGAGIR